MRYRLELGDEAREQLRALEKDMIFVHGVKDRKDAYRH